MSRRQWSAFTLSLLMSFLGSFLTSCAHSGKDLLLERQSQARPDSDAYAGEGFYNDYSPEPRDARKWQFYYKDCELVDRHPWPRRGEYDCNDPF